MKVEGEKPHPPGEILYVDVIVRQASVLEELLPFTRPDGADIVPKDAIVPPGSNYQERRRQNLRQMDRSQKIAAAVALRELGYKVVAKPEGALIVAVAPDSPADGKIEATEVIVGVDGTPVKTPDDLRRLIAEAQARREGAALGARRRRDTRASRSGRSRAPSRRAGRSSASRSSSPPTSSCRSTSRSTSAASAGLRPGSRSRSTSSTSCAATSTEGSRSLRRARSSSTGSVAPIGGVKQKVIGARRSGADVFLVPAGDNAEGGTPTCRGSSRDPCGEFSTGVACPGNLAEKT